MDYTVQTISSQLKESYKIILLCLAVGIAIQYSSHIPFEIFESSFVIRTAIVAFPLAVAISGFVISKMYSSKVFGKSYFMLGLSYLFYFIGESIYFFYADPLNIEDPLIADLFFIISGPMLIIHIIINIRYFAEKLEDYQKLLLIIIPTVTILGYSFFVNINLPQDISEFYFNLIFVTSASVMLAFTTVAFTLFRHTVLFVPWFLLLIGILISTAGDITHSYAETLRFYDYGNFSTSLWIASNLMIIYALYKHKKSI